MTDMKHMARSKKERTEMNKPSAIGGDKYPYGLRVDLGHEEMQKLGMDSMPKVGDKVHLQSHAHVVSASESSHEGDDEPQRRVSLELRHMAVGPAPKEGTIEDPTADGMKGAMDEALSKPTKPAKKR
jgi:hypothetical protein